MNKKKLLLIFSLITGILSLGTIFNSPYQSGFLNDINIKLLNYQKFYPQQKVYLHINKSEFTYNDIIRVKAYLLNANSHVPDSTDHTLYVQLINPSGQTVQTKIARMLEGKGECDFILLDTVPDGVYMIKAYTNWMRNFGEEFFFSKEVYVNNPLFTTKASRPAVLAERRIQKKTSRQRMDFDVSFLPEGGQMLAETPGWVAFKAINEAGEGIHITGELKDKRNRTVLEFSSTHKGMGAFYFTPEKGNSYKAVINSEEYRTKKIDLPKPIERGIAISAESTAEFIDISIRTNIVQYPPNTTYYFIGHIRGTAYFTRTLDLKDTTSLSFQIAKKNLPDGIMHLTLFNYNQSPISERLVFVNNGQRNFVQISSNKQEYSKRELVKASMTAASPEGFAVQSDFSVSVFPYDSLNPHTGMVSYLLLSSDLKGRIEDPDYYFSKNNQDSRKALNLLMMTQGWRRFKWTDVQNARYAPLPYEKEKGLVVDGVITKFFFGIPLENAKVTLTAVDEFNDVFNTESDNKGYFRFENLIYYDTVNFQLDAERERGGKNLLIVLNEKPQPQIVDPIYKSDRYITRKDPKGVRTFEEEEEEEESDRFGSIHSEPRDVIIVDETMHSYSNVLQILQGRVPGVNVVGNRVIIRGVGTFTGSTDPLYLVDGRAVSPDYALNISPFDVERIEILKGPEASVYGVRGGNGVIAIFTKRGSYMIRGRLNFTMLGYARPYEFYSPKYGEGIEGPKNDTRMNLFWMPELKTDKEGKASFEFYTSDTPGSFTIRVEGISDEGIPTSAAKMIEVR
jgi:TonB-dependent SusC/RagA subfamily outer membrane receptor